MAASRKPTDPAKTATMAGGLFAVDREFFWKVSTINAVKILSIMTSINSGGRLRRGDGGLGGREPGAQLSSVEMRRKHGDPPLQVSLTFQQCFMSFEVD